MQTSKSGNQPIWLNTDAHFMEDILINLSHELRTPLAAAKGYATSLLRYDDRLPHDERMAMVSEIDLACDRLENVIAQMLQAARLLQDTVTLQCHQHDLAHLTQSAIELLAHVAPQHTTEDHPIIFQHDPAHLALVFVDERLMTTTLAHLLENACNFSPKGQPITISLVSHENTTEWSVQDQGLGIAPDHLPRIFDPFYRVTTDLTRDVGGLGLGLTFVQRVIALHGGTLHVESQLGQGSRFWFALPSASAG